MKHIYKSPPHWEKKTKTKCDGCITKLTICPYAYLADNDNQDSHNPFYSSNTEGNWKTKIHVSWIFYTLCILPSVIWASCDFGKYMFMIVDRWLLMMLLWKGTYFFMQFNMRSFRCWSLWNHNINACILFKTAPVSYSLHN